LAASNQKSPPLTWKDNLTPLVHVSLFIVRIIDQNKYAIASQDLKIADVNSVFTVTPDGKIQPRYSLALDSLQLSINDQGLILNLNSDLLQGKRPGNKAGDIAVLPLSGGPGGAITDASITTLDIENGAITSDKLAPALRLDINVGNTSLPPNITLQGSIFNGASQLVQLTAGGALSLSGLSASSISTGANTLTITSSNFNTTSTGINATAVRTDRESRRRSFRHPGPVTARRAPSALTTIRRR